MRRTVHIALDIDYDINSDSPDAANRAEEILRLEATSIPNETMAPANEYEELGLVVRNISYREGLPPEANEVMRRDADDVRRWRHRATEAEAEVQRLKELGVLGRDTAYRRRDEMHSRIMAAADHLAGLEAANRNAGKPERAQAFGEAAGFLRGQFPRPQSEVADA